MMSFGTPNTTRICPVCDKEFFPASEHKFKIKIRGKDKKVCSWHCVRTWEKKNENKHCWD